MDKVHNDFKQKIFLIFIYTLCQFAAMLIMHIWIVFCAIEYKSDNPDLNKLNPIYSTSFGYWAPGLFLSISGGCAIKSFVVLKKIKNLF